MKTLIASLALALSTFTAAFAGTTALPAKAGLASHHIATREDNAVLFAYRGETGTHYNWTQVEGPSHAHLTGSNTPTLIATRLKPGFYVFNYTATAPDGSQTTDQVVIKVKNPQS